MGKRRTVIMVIKNKIDPKERYEYFFNTYCKNIIMDEKQTAAIKRCLRRRITDDEMSLIIKTKVIETGENILVYNQDQIEALQKAVLANLSKNQIELLANPDYPSFKMEAIMAALLYRFDEQKVNLLRKVKCSEDSDKAYMLDVMECMKKGASVEELEFVKRGEEKFELPFDDSYCMTPEKKHSLLEAHTRHGSFERETCTHNDKNKFMGIYSKKEQTILTNLCLTNIQIAMERGVKAADIKKYMDQADRSNLSLSQASRIIQMLIDNVPEECIEKTITGEYNAEQMHALTDVYKLELTEEQLKIITNNMYDDYLMRQIANAFLCGITVEEILSYIKSIYKIPNAGSKLEAITQAILRNEHPESLVELAAAGFDGFQIDQIETCYTYRLTEDEMTVITNKDFDKMKIAYLREMMLDGCYEIAELLENTDQKHSDIIEIMYDANCSYEAIMKGIECEKARDNCNTDISDNDLVDLICKSRDLDWTRTCIENKFELEQINVLLKAGKRGFSKSQLKAIANKNLTAEQMAFLVDHICPEKNKSDRKIKEWDTAIGSITVTEHIKSDADVR